MASSDREISHAFRAENGILVINFAANGAVLQVPRKIHLLAVAEFLTLRQCGHLLKSLMVVRSIASIHCGRLEAS
jgi:hypothetical protein